MKIKRGRDKIAVTFTEDESKSLFTVDESKPVVTVMDEQGRGGCTRTLVRGPMTWKFTFKKGKLNYEATPEELNGRMGLAIPPPELVLDVEKYLLDRYGT